MKKLFFLIFVISTVSSAPAGKDSLFDIVKNDVRTKDLQKRRLINECRRETEISRSICFALYDVSLTFNSKNLSFNIVNATFELDTFCQSFKQVLPDSPANNDSVVNFKDSAKWLKDIDEEQCKKKCIFDDPDNYERSLVNVCRFLFNQYTFLSGNGLQQTVKDIKPDEKKSEEKTTEEKPSEVVSTQTKAGIIPAADKQNISGTSPQASAVEISSQGLVNSTESKNAEVKTNVESFFAQTTAVLKEQKIPESVADTEKKPILQTSPATTTQQKPAEEPSKVSEDKPKVDDQNADQAQPNAGDVQPNTGDQVQPNGDQLQPSISDDDDDETSNKFPFDEPDASEPPEDGKLDYQDPDDDDESIDQMQKNNNIAPVLPQEYDTDSLKLANNEPQTLIKQVPFEENPDSNFFAYLCTVMFLCVFLYILLQNRQKLLALCLEGRRGSRRSSRSRGGSKAAYSKLDCNLEEAITSNKSMSGKSMDIIY